MACVRKRRGKWVVDYYKGNVRKTPSFGTKFEAETFKRELLLRNLDLETGFLRIKSVSVSSAVHQYLETITVKKEPRTHEVDNLALSHFLERFQANTVQEIELQDLEAYQMVLLKDGLKASSVNRKFNVIRHFFRKCLEWKYCSENPTANLTKLKEESVKRVPFKRDELIQIINALPLWAARAFYFASLTGARRGSICSLTWDMVDFETGFIKLESKKGGKVVRSMDLPMTNGVLRLLNEIYLERKQFSTNHVFLNSEGRVIIPSTLTRKVIEVSRKLGLKGAGLHLARHTILTDLSSLNQSGSIIQKVAGHSNLNTSQKYVHHNQNEVRQALQALEVDRAVNIPLKLVSS